jgi:hypothetical protein
LLIYDTIFFYIRKVKWKNNQIDNEILNNYLTQFGELFYTQIKRLIDEAILKERAKEANMKDVYRQFGLLNEKNPSQDLNNEVLNEFKSLIHELSFHVNQYNELNSKFFGRDYLMEDVNYIFLIHSIKFLIIFFYF